MTDPTAFDPIGSGHIMIPNNSPKTFEDRTTIQHDEHIARLTQEIEDLRSELIRVRDLTNLSITFQSPLPEPRSTAPNPPRFPSLDSPLITTPVNPSNPPPSIQNTPIVQTYLAQHIQRAHIATPYALHVPPVYAVENQAFTNPISVKFQPKVDQYEKMKKDVKVKDDDMLAREIRDLKEAMRNLQLPGETKA
ncbi:hypothetical protein H5410_037428 [Solanum commersonii]|uniref:Uncharacterized protein n=1 Tax=Solanum commersonii TaxID=4109 RepID=A0A9J5YA67_SOLCO|nr:hypothetical protein H5410_037428 [Solanum commersonii]